MNRGGFSWKRLLGISAFKSRVSRTIGVPLTANGRRRKLGASVFNAVGPIAGTLAVAAVAVTKQLEKSNKEATASGSSSAKGAHFCLVKGVTHNNDDGTSRSEAQHLCSIGDTVKLVPEPNNEHDQHAIKVVLQTGQQIGYISTRQAARFDGIVHLLTATVYSRAEDEWGNSTIKLRVVNSAEQKAHNADLPIAKGQSPSHDPISDVQTLQAEAKEEAKKQGWQPEQTLIYFENAERGLYQVVLAENTEHMRQTIQAGLTRVGFIGGKDAPKGIQFGFSLDDRFPTNGTVAKRFLANAREWVVTKSEDLCAQKGLRAPIVHEFDPTKQFATAQLRGSTPNVASSNPGISPLKFVLLLGVVGLLVGVFTGEWLLFLTIILIAVVAGGVAMSRR
jgi:hypothetical protein